MLLTLAMPPARGMVVASMLTGDYALAKEAGAVWPDVIRALAADYLAIKRWGYGAWTLNAAALATTGVFLGALAAGIRRKDAGWRMVGIWGLLTSVNLHLGWLQFTDYQREGWSFLLALACAGGMGFAAAWRWRRGRAWRRAWGGGLAALALAGLALPPRHVLAAGPAESDLVRVVLDLEPETTVLVRRTSSFPGGQGDVVRTLHPRVVHSAEELAGATGPIVFLRDRPPEKPLLSAAMRLLQPRQIRTLERFWQQAEEDNLRLEAGLAGRPMRVERISDRLDLWTVEIR